MNIKQPIAFLFFILLTTITGAQDITIQLNALSQKYDFRYEELKTDTFFIQKFILNIKQPKDHAHPELGSFETRVFLSHYSFDSPNVFITEGYGAYYAANSRYINELSELLGANQVCVEHRYFGKSVPTPLDWQYHTISNAASDHHRVIEILKEIYTGKWISTGISKGGQTAMYHRYFYPDDVDASVAYVCPLNFSIEDKRVYRFLNEVGDSISRKIVFDYQYEMLKNKAVYMPVFKKMANEKGITFPVEILKAYELTVLEYSFAFWQWGAFSVQAVPFPPESPEKMVQHLNNVAGIDWISSEGIEQLQAFFYQALREIGFYGYDITPFKDVISFETNPDFGFTSPKGAAIIYDPLPMQNVDCFIRHSAENMIFIYGENDPWSATAVDLTYKNNLIKIVKPGGNHLTRLKNLPEKDFNFVMQILKSWLTN